MECECKGRNLGCPVVRLNGESVKHMAPVECSPGEHGWVRVLKPHAGIKVHPAGRRTATKLRGKVEIVLAAPPRVISPSSQENKAESSPPKEEKPTYPRRSRLKEDDESSTR